MYVRRWYHYHIPNALFSVHTVEMSGEMRCCKLSCHNRKCSWFDSALIANICIYVYTFTNILIKIKVVPHNNIFSNCNIPLHYLFSAQPPFNCVPIGYRVPKCCQNTHFQVLVEEVRDSPVAHRNHSIHHSHLAHIVFWMEGKITHDLTILLLLPIICTSVLTI